MSEKREKSVGCLQWAIVGTVGLLGVLLLVSWYSEAQMRQHQMTGVSNCRDIITSVKVFAGRNSGAFPDVEGQVGRQNARSANAVFRWLFEEGCCGEELIFGCPGSEFVPDGQIGKAPDFAQALTPGECHWMMLKDQMDTSVGNTPLVIENALNVSWPPRWEVSSNAGQKKGRAWKGRQIIIGQLDGSVTLESLHADGTLDVRKHSAVWNWVDMHAREGQPLPSYLDIEERGTP